MVLHGLRKEVNKWFSLRSVFLKDREGRRAVDFPLLCMLSNESTISERIQTHYTSIASLISVCFISNGVSNLVLFLNYNFIDTDFSSTIQNTLWGNSDSKNDIKITSFEFSF